MGSTEDLGSDPLTRLQQSQWQSLKSNGKVEYPVSLDPLWQVKDRIVPPCADALKNIQMPSFFSKFPHPMDVTMMPSSQRRFIIVDQSGNRTRLMFSSMSPVEMPDSIDNKLKPLSHPTFQEYLPVNNNWFENQSRTNSISTEHKVDEMHENTEEIDALLYSDSEDEEEASPGCDFWNAISMRTDRNGKLSSVKGEVQLRVVNTCKSDMVAIHKAKNLEEDSIRETLDALMHIIPGNIEGKDVIEVLDEGISYLKSLKAKYSVLSGSSL